MYETVLSQLSATESQLLELYKKKKIHSETIKFAVSKSPKAPKLDEDSQGDLVELAIEQKADFDACLARRDALAERLVLPRHRVLNTMGDFYEKLTAPLPSPIQPVWPTKWNTFHASLNFKPSWKFIPKSMMSNPRFVGRGPTSWRPLNRSTKTTDAWLNSSISTAQAPKLSERRPDGSKPIWKK